MMTKALQKELLKDVYVDKDNWAARKDWWAEKSVNTGFNWNMHWLDKAIAKYKNMAKQIWHWATSNTSTGDGPGVQVF